MAKKQPSRKSSTAKTRRDPGKVWTSLTWDDVEQWSGGRSVTRGRTYQRNGRVKELAATEDGRLLATVSGGARYVVSVWREPANKARGSIESKCTCPVGYSGCKHAVAVVAAYLQALADEEVVPLAEENDPRWARLEGSKDEFEDELTDPREADEEEYEEEYEKDHGKTEALPKKKMKGTASRRTRAEWDEMIREHVHGKSGEELAEFVCSLVERFPELREEIQERIALGEGDVGRLLAQARHELLDLTSQIAWRNSWNDEGYTPDYSRLKHRLERLTELGHADAIVELGPEIIRRGMAQVEESHDEGETAMELADCLLVVFDAVEKSSLSGSQKILFAIDACLQDGYDVMDEAVGVIFDAKRPKTQWSSVADELSRRLKKTAKNTDEFSYRYGRGQLSSWLLTALGNAGRDDELLAVYETEARATGSFERLVTFLIAERKYEDAQRWAEEGIEKTCEKLPGIASSLAGKLCEVARLRRKWDVVAAHVAWCFFDRPSADTFKELVKRATTAKCGKPVRAAAIHFLETGESPVQRVVITKGKGKGQRTLRVDPAWPLPVPEYLVPLMSRDRPVYARAGPHYNVLLDMAIAAKKPDKVLHWYDKVQAGAKPFSGSRGGRWRDGSTAGRVAKAVAKSHPERTLEIYRTELNSHLPHANMSDYESTAAYLELMRPIMKSLECDKEWGELVAEIREKYSNRPRFMEILDSLEGRSIVETQKARRRKRN